MSEGDSSAQARLLPRVAEPEARGILGTRYEVYGEIASGGMATVQYGRLIGPRGFARAVAIKRLHPHFAKEPDFVSMFVDEARLSARLVHANIIPTLDVVETPGELALVMEYVHGESLWTLLKLSAARGALVPVRVACALITSVLYGLHAAHETRSDAGLPLDIVHRDVSPQNILVGADGIPRVLDFGIARAIGHLRSTPSGEIKGKLAYISPEQLHGAGVDRRADIYGASVVLWETLTGHALFDGPNESAIVNSVLHGELTPPSAHRSEVPASLDAIVMRGLQREASQRFATAREMAISLEREVGLATQSEVSDWLHELAGVQLAERAQKLQNMQEAANHAPASTEPQTSTRRIDATSQRPVALESEAQPPAQRRAPWVSMSLLLLALAVIGAWLLHRTGQQADKTESPLAPLVRPTPVRAVELEAQPPSAAPAVVERLPMTPSPTVDAVVPEALPPSASPTPDAEPLGDTTNTAASKIARPANTKVKAVTIPSKRCTPYYFIDAAGIRRPKPGCL